MTTSAHSDDLFADALEPELPGIADAILVAIGREVPEYARPLDGAFGRGVRTGVTEALGASSPSCATRPRPTPASRVYLALGRNELRAGRTLDALQSAYRTGARVAWRRMADVAVARGFGHEDVTRLAEAIFAYIDELSAESVDGYAQAQSEQAGRARAPAQRARRARCCAAATSPRSLPPSTGRRRGPLPRWRAGPTAWPASRAASAPRSSRR